MDILHKLRILFWFLVTAIWGIFLYQYMSDDLNAVPKIKLSHNTFSNGRKTIIKRKYIERENIQSSEIYTSSAAQQNIKITTETMPTVFQSSSSRIYVDLKEIKDIPSMHIEREKSNISQHIPETTDEDAPPPPPGFEMAKTKHFFVYQEEKVEKSLLEDIENLHGNIILDLVAFSPWQRDKRVSIYFAKNPQTYQKLTGRPAWSGGAADSVARKIYLYESEEAFGILAHELTHIYFDSFFDKKINPLWLSEGMAVYIQVERGGSYPRWLKENLEILKNGGGYKVKDLMRIETLEGADDKSVKLWYAQSYSLVLFLMRAKMGDAFYQFCKNMNNGDNVSLALFKAYGAPYNKISSLEVVWRYDLKTGKLSQFNH